MADERRTLGDAMWAIVVVVMLALYALHRAALWAEDRGWIFYKRKRGPAPWLGTLESIYKPDVEYVIEEESARRIRADEDESGEGDPGRPG